MKSDSQPIAVSNLSVLRFTGPDSLSFLQGQLSNDLNALSSSWHYSGYCNPKGRLLALFQVWRNEQIIYASIDSSLVDATIKRLRMFVMRSKVVIDELTQARCLGLTDIDNNSERFSVDINESIHTLYLGTRALRIDLEPSDQMPSADTIDSQQWDLANIAEGEPTIDADNVEMFIPQMVNLDLLGGINFKKGCYTGQEIVARMHYLGKLKQRMFVCQLEGNASSGEKVISGDKNAGNIVAASAGSALAVIRRDLVNSELQTVTGTKLVPLSVQPYTIPD
ncbi:MAG: folate-binding protein YgfZ [Arenicella sp.]|jgi:folate-binding protein YgfZ